MKHTSAVPVFCVPVIAIVGCRAMLIARGRAPDKTNFALLHPMTLAARWRRIGPACPAGRRALPNHVVSIVAGVGHISPGVSASPTLYVAVFQRRHLALHACTATPQRRTPD
jgi:hypothetical protein